MSRLFGFMCNEPDRLACALHPAREALTVRGAPDGWGVAFFQGGEVLLQRHPKPAPNPLEFYGKVKDLRSDYLVGVVGEPMAHAKLENTQPYRFRSWVFAQAGTVPGFPSVQPALLESVPDFLRRDIRGTNDSEHIFHLFLAFLHDGGKLDDPNIRAIDAASALRATTALVDRLAGAAASLNFVLTNGRILLASRRGRALYLHKTNGVTTCPVCREAHPEWREDRRRVTHEHLRSVLLVTEPEKVPPGFEEVPDGTILAVARDLATSVVPSTTE